MGPQPSGTLPLLSTVALDRLASPLRKTQTGNTVARAWWFNTTDLQSPSTVTSKGHFVARASDRRGVLLLDCSAGAGSEFKLADTLLSPDAMNGAGAEPECLTRLRANDTQLTHLVLSDSGSALSEGGARDLAAALERNGTLTSLHCEFIDIGDDGARALSRALESNTTLATLTLVGVGIGADGARALAAALDRNITLTAFYCVSNSIGVDGACAFARALGRNTTLTSVSFENNKLDVEGARAFSAALERNATLTSINLGANNICDGGSCALAAALERNATIQSIDLDCNSIGVDGAQAVAAALERNATLLTLALSANDIGDDGAGALASALEKNTTLTVMDLALNTIGVDGTRALAAALKTNTTLTWISLVNMREAHDGTAEFRTFCASYAFRTAFASNFTLCELRGVKGVDDLLARNRLIVQKRKQKCLHVAVLLLGLKRYNRAADLRFSAKEVVRLIARLVWRTKVLASGLGIPLPCAHADSRPTLLGMMSPSSEQRQGGAQCTGEAQEVKVTVH